jgi:hypothetical protein
LLLLAEIDRPFVFSLVYSFGHEKLCKRNLAAPAERVCHYFPTVEEQFHDNRQWRLAFSPLLLLHHRARFLMRWYRAFLGTLVRGSLAHDPHLID